MNQSINDEAVCRTALATLGLLKMANEINEGIIRKVVLKNSIMSVLGIDFVNTVKNSPLPLGFPLGIDCPWELPQAKGYI